MRVLFMVNVPSPYRVDFFNALGKLCDLTVLFETRSAKSRDVAWRADSIKDFKGVFMKGLRTGEAEAICPEVIKYLSRKKFDVIIVGMYSSPTGMLAIEYMRARGIPFILSSDGGIKKMDAGIKYKMKKHFIGAASAWLSTGKETTEYLCYYGANKKNVHTYPFTSISEADIRNANSICKKDKFELKKDLDIIEEKIILTVGRFTYEGGYGKGYDVLLKAAKMFDDSVGIYIVGGEPTEEFKKWKQEKKLNNVHFIDFKTKKELAKYYAVADIFVLLTKYDVWGLVINEAMSYSLPIITTNKCGAGLEMVKSGNGYIIDVCDVNQFYIKASEILLNDEKRKKFSELSYEIAKEYTIENMATIHMNVFQEFIRNKNNF